jgi:hypothetical protein
MYKRLQCKSHACRKYIKQSEAFPDPQSAHYNTDTERERERKRFTSVSGYWYFGVVSFRISVWEPEEI